MSVWSGYKPDAHSDVGDKSRARRLLSGARILLQRGASATGLRAGDDEDGDPTVLIDGTFLRRVEKLHFNAPRTATAGLAGEHISRRKAHSVEFADHRNYAPGDDFRLVDWNVYARLGELFLKLTEARENLSLHILIDCSPSMDWGRPNKLLYAKRVAAALGAMALAGYDTVSLGAFSAQLTAVFPPLRGRSAVGVLLEHLTSLQAGASTDLERSVAEYCGSVGRRGVAILLTDFLVPNGHEEALGYLARSGLNTTALHLVDRQEQHPDLSGLVELRDSETDELVKVAITPHLLRRYDGQFKSWSDNIALACRARRAHYVQVPTIVPPQTLVLHTLRREGLLR